MNDEDRDLGHLLRPGTGSSESTADVAEHLAGLGRGVALAWTLERVLALGTVV